MLLCPLLATQSATRALWVIPVCKHAFWSPARGFREGAWTRGQCRVRRETLRVATVAGQQSGAPVAVPTDLPQSGSPREHSKVKGRDCVCIWLERSKPKWITTLEWTQSDSANSKTIWIASEHCVILQTDIGIYVEKENQSASLRSCRTVFLTRTRKKKRKRAAREKKKSPLNRLLSDTHGFIYSVLHCIYTSLYKKGPFIEGSYCKSSTRRPMTASGPFVLEFFLMYSQREKEKAWDWHGWLFLQTQRNRSAPTHVHALRSRCDNKKKNWANKHRAKEIEEKEGRKGRRERRKERDISCDWVSFRRERARTEGGDGALHKQLPRTDTAS